MTDSPRQLPGVNGQWIKTSECPPTIADLDKEGDLVVRLADGSRTVISLSEAGGYELWRPRWPVDPRPLFTLEPATTERRIVQLSRHSGLVYVVADDGTAWMRFAGDEDSWHQMRGLPPREA